MEVDLLTCPVGTDFCGTADHLGVTANAAWRYSCHRRIVTSEGLLGFFKHLTETGKTDSMGNVVGNYAAGTFAGKLNALVLLWKIEHTLSNLGNPDRAVATYILDYCPIPRKLNSFTKEFSGYKRATTKKRAEKAGVDQDVNVALPEEQIRLVYLAALEDCAYDPVNGAPITSKSQQAKLTDFNARILLSVCGMLRGDLPASPPSHQ